MSDVNIKARIIVESDEATKGISDVKNELKETATAAKSVANGGNFDKLKDSLSAVSPAAKSANNALGGFNSALNVIRANPIIGVLTLVAGVIVGLFNQFKKMEAVSDTLGVAWKTLSGLFSGFINSVLTPLIDGFTSLVNLFTGSLINVLDALGLASKETATQLAKNAEVLDDLEDAEKNAAIAMAESNRKLQEAREIAADANVPIKERIAALQEAGKIEKKELDNVVEINRAKTAAMLSDIALELGAKDTLIAKIKEGSLASLNAARAELLLMKNVDKTKFDAINAQIIAAENAAAQSAKIGKKTDAAIRGLQKEQEAKEKEIADKAKSKREKELQEQQKYLQAKEKIVEDNLLKEAANAEVADLIKQGFDFKKQLKEIDNLRVSEAKKTELKKIVEETNEIEIAKIKQKYFDERVKKDEDEKAKAKAIKDKEAADFQKAFEDSEKIELDAETKRIESEKARRVAQIELQQELIDSGLTPEQLELSNLEATYQKKLELAKGNEELLLSVKKQYAEQKKKLEELHNQQQLSMVSGALGKISEVVGKQTAAGKGLAVAEATINTLVAGTNALKAIKTAKTPFEALAGIATMATVIASGFKTVKAITEVPVPGGGGGGGGIPLPSIQAPIAPQQVSTQLNANSIQGIGNAAAGGVNRSFVLASDITNASDREKALQRAARLG